MKTPKDTLFSRFTKKYPLVHMTAALTLLTVVVALALGFVHAQTAPVLEKLQEETLREAISQVLPGGVESESLTAEAWPAMVRSVRAVKDGAGALCGFAVETTPSGFAGEVRLLVGVSDEGVVTGVAVLDMKETPNLGTKVRSDEFLKQFIGKESGMELGSGAEDVHAITGATISSKAVHEGVKAAVAAVLQYTGGGASE